MIKKEQALKSRNSIIVKLTGKSGNEPEEIKKVKAKRVKAKSEKKKTKEAKPAVKVKKDKRVKTATVAKVAPVTKTPKAPKAPKVKKEVAPKKEATPKTKTTKKEKAQIPTITAEVLAGFSFAPAVISTNQINIDYFITKLRTIADLQDDTNYRLQVLTEELETLQTNLKNKGEN